MPEDPSLSCPLARPVRAAPPDRRRGRQDHDDTQPAPPAGRAEPDRGHRWGGHPQGHPHRRGGRHRRPAAGAPQFPATAAGYAALLAWLRTLGQLVLVGVEGTGVYGAGLARFLQAAGVALVEVDRPDRKARRWQGKSDPVDAEAAARAALAGAHRHPEDPRRPGRSAAGAAGGAPQRGRGPRRCAAPDQGAGRHRARRAARALRGLGDRRADRALRRPAAPTAARAGDPAVATKLALRSLARRHLQLTDEIDELDALIGPLVAAISPALLELPGVGPDVAGQLLVTAGENPDRLRSEAAFAMLCGAAPLPASSGQDQPAPAQPRRRPPGQRRALPHRALPAALGPPHPRLRRSDAPPKA